MKKIFTSVLAVIIFTVAATAQVKLKLDPAASFSKKASSALKSGYGKQQAFKNVKAGEECSVFVEAKKNDAGATYNAAKEFLIISNDGVTGFGFTFFTADYKGNKLLVMRGLPLESGVCVDNTTSLVITFEDGEQLTVKNYDDANCKGVITTYFGDILKNMSAVESLKTKKARSFKLVAVEKTIVKSLSEGNQQQLQGTFKCL
jgi:hypothetical protein